MAVPLIHLLSFHHTSCMAASSHAISPSLCEGWGRPPTKIRRQAYDIHRWDRLIRLQVIHTEIIIVHFNAAVKISKLLRPPHVQRTAASWGTMAQEEGGEVERRSEEKTNKQLFLRLLNFISNDDKKTLAIACIAMSLTSVNNLAFPKIISNLIDSMSNSSNTQAKRKLVVSSLIMFAVGAVGSWLRTYLFTIASDSVSKRLRVELFKAILKQESGFFDQTPVQDMQCRMTDDVQAMANATTSNFAKVYRYTNSALGGSIMLFSISPRLTVATLGVVPLVGVTGMLYGMRAKKMSKKMKENISRIASSVDEKLANIRTVRLFSMEDYEGEEYANLLNSTQEDVKHAAHAEGLFLGGLAFGGFTSLLGVLYYGGTLVERNLITVGALTSFAMYSATVGLGFSGLSQVCLNNPMLA